MIFDLKNIDLEKALSYLEGAYAHKPQHSGVALALGLALANLGRKKEAMQYLEKALVMASEGGEKQQ